MHVCSQPSHFEIFSVHDYVIKAKKNWEPVLDHRIVDANILWARCGKTTFWRAEHDWDDAAEHRDRKETDLLVFAHFTKVRDAYR